MRVPSTSALLATLRQSGPSGAAAAGRCQRMVAPAQPGQLCAWRLSEVVLHKWAQGHNEAIPAWPAHICTILRERMQS